MTATCAAGKRVVGGGYSAVTGAVTVTESFPSESAPTLQDQWTVIFSGLPTTATVYAICVTFP
jgi:hypothetical protein